MYLKRLEMQGFKSFAERIVIELEKGITVIVGPNGCGKSNLTDAVHWALGEQSARSLRGRRMDDVIFSGASGRRPLGMAEVMLTFDNSERMLSLPYEEISITRRVYRSGEGEYYINKQLCRLRDIQELFAQCGIGRAAFSITSQGKIDEFILARPQERRVLLEEIAGVSSYRQRKSDALKKLAETEDSLARLGDLLSELERTLIPLKKQAEVAEQYRRIAQEQRETESSLLGGQLSAVDKKERELHEECGKLESSLAYIQQSMTTTEGRLSELQQGLTAQYKEVEQKESELGEIQRALQESHSALARLEEKSDSLEHRIAELQARIAVVAQRRQETEQEMDDAASAYKKLSLLRLQAESDVQKLSAEKEEWEEQKKETEKRWESVDKEIFEVLYRKTSLVSDLQVQKNKREALLHRRQSLAQKIDKGKAACLELEAKIRQLEEQCKQHAASQEHFQAELEKEERAEQTLREKQEQNSAEILSLTQKIDRLNERFRVLKEAEDSREGYQYGVKRILQKLAEGVKFDGDKLSLVEELLEIPPLYETALDTALGRAAHYFVCTTPQAAQEAIALLKREKAGRASFFPLQALDRWTFQERDNVVHVQGLIGRLSELVTCEQRYRQLAEYLLGRTYLADNLQSASLFADKNNYRLRVVTMEGELIQAGGLFTGGGGRSRFPSTRRRKRELKELQQQVEEERRKLASCRRRDQKLKSELEQANSRIDDLQERIKQEEETGREQSQKATAGKEELIQLTESGENYLLEKDELLRGQQDFDRQIQALEQELESIAAQEREVEDKRAELEKARRRMDDKTQITMSALSAAQVSYGTISQDLKHQEQKREQLRQLLELRSQEQSKMEKDLAEIKAEREIIQKQEESLSKEVAALTGRQESVEHNILFRKKQAAAEKRYIDAKEKRYLKLKEIAFKSEQRIESSTVKARHLVDLKEQIYSQARENNFQIGFFKDREPLSRREELALKEKSAAFKQEMAAFGEINFAAPGECLAVEERIIYLKQQMKDLQGGKSSLTGMIDEMDRIVAVRFRNTFQQVRADFEKIFSLLSDGGKADLLLTDEDDLLETGIDICVNPRGKKQLHLSLLSGGEKSLTGIAFLFALLQSNPSPFYLLDEIEAFLDEANLARFANFLRTWGAGYQLILISHRYQTMEIADHLFGVTMEEPGISKLVSVHLEEYAPGEQPELSDTPSSFI
jgi:chromosome segregation protein